MTREQKSKYELIGVGSLIAIALAFCVYLNEVKAENSTVEKLCNKQEKVDDLIIDLRLEVKEIHTLLKEKLK